MRRVKNSGALLIVTVLFFVMSGCGNDKQGGGVGEKVAPKDLEEWSYEQKITTPIEMTAYDEDVVLGDVAQQDVVITVPAGAFEGETQVTLKTPDEVPGYVGEDLEMIGAPIEIDSSGEQRLNESLKISFRVDGDVLADDYERGALRMIYHDGMRWDTIKPIAFDEEKGTITFQMYHFSYGGLSKAKKKVITKKWIESKSLENYISTSTDELSGALAEKAIDLTLAKMGITDNSIKGALVSDIVKNDAYKEMFEDYQKGDVAGFNEKFAVLMGEKIAQRVPESSLKGALGSLLDAKDDVKVVAQAAGYAAEGQYKEAAKMVGEMISDKFLITTAGKIAVEVIQGQIDGWKNEEIDAAYKAYKDGANGRFWGYNVDAGDFDEVWRQMRGVGRQIELDAINKENEIRVAAGMPEMTDTEMEKVRIKIKESTRKQFESRAKGDDKIAHEEKQLEILMEAFDKIGFLDKDGGPQGLRESGHDLETKLNVLHHFAKKVLRDTGRVELTDKEWMVTDTKVSMDHITLASRYWFSKPDGRKKYAEFLNDKFGISIHPPLKDLGGAWSNGKMVITDVVISDEMKRQMEDPDSAAEEGCDFNINFEELIGQEMPMVFAIDPSGDAAGTLNLTVDGDAKEFPFTYTNSTINATGSQEGAAITITLPVTTNDNGYVTNGTMKVDYSNGALVITATATATKSKSK